MNRAAATGILRAVCLVGAVAVLVGCGGSGTERAVTPPPSTAQARPTVAPVETEAPVETFPKGDAFEDAGDPAVGEPLPTDALTSEPEITGFPALTDPNDFCRNYALMTQSVYVVGITVSSGGGPLVPRGEVVGARTFLLGVEGLKKPWPDGLEGERSALAAQYAGYVARAEKAIELLYAAGVDDAGLARIDADWRAVMTSLPIGFGLEDVPVNAADAPKIDAAVDAFVSALPARTADPAIAASDAAPATDLVDTWTDDNCAANTIDSGEGDDVDLGEPPST